MEERADRRQMREDNRAQKKATMDELRAGRRQAVGELRAKRRAAIAEHVAARPESRHGHDLANRAFRRNFGLQPLPTRAEADEAAGSFITRDNADAEFEKLRREIESLR